MEMFGPALFVLALVVPALLLIALMSRTGKDAARSNMSERSRVQMQREQNIRRRFDERRRRVWSAIESAYMDFTNHEQIAEQAAARSDSAPLPKHHTNAAPDWWSDLTDSRLAEIFDNFQAPTPTRRGKARNKARASRDAAN